MIAAIVAHLGIGLGALVCRECGDKMCRCKRHAWSLTGALLVAEAIASVIVIDKLFAI